MAKTSQKPRPGCVAPAFARCVYCGACVRVCACDLCSCSCGLHMVQLIEYSTYIKSTHMRRGGTPDGRHPEAGDRVECQFGLTAWFAGEVQETDAQGGKPPKKMNVIFDDKSEHWIKLNKGWKFEASLTTPTKQVCFHHAAICCVCPLPLRGVCVCVCMRARAHPPFAVSLARRRRRS